MNSAVHPPDARLDNRTAVIVGEPQSIRSDEYLVWSPLQIGQRWADFPERRIFGLTDYAVKDSWRPAIPYPNIGQLIFSPKNIPFFLPSASLGFAFSWWLPFFAATIGFFIWLRTIRIRTGIAIPASLLVTITPAAAWWSQWNLVGIAHVTFGCAFLIVASNKRSSGLLRCFSGVISIWAFAGLPWYYQPWALSAAIVFIPITAIFLITETCITRNRDKSRFVIKARQFAVDLGPALIISLVTVFLWVVYLMHEWDYYASLSNTVYPGQRRSLGGGLKLGHLFSSVAAWDFQTGAGKSIRNSNLSEISTSWSILIVYVLILWIGGIRPIEKVARNCFFACIAIAGIIIGWSLISFPSFITVWNPLQLIPPVRIAPYLGVVATIAFAIQISNQKNLSRKAWLPYLQMTVFIGFVLFVLVSIKNNFLPLMSVTSIIVSCALMSVVLLLLLINKHIEAIWSMTVMALLCVCLVNPITYKFGDIATSKAARLVSEIDSASMRQSIWATDDIYLVSLLNFQGINSLSSFNDPVGENWRIIDKSGEFEASWNRFAYINFNWNEDSKQIVITSPYPDVIEVNVNPCDKSLRKLQLTHIISSRQLPIASKDCLHEVDQFKWYGIIRYLYSLN
jgi:hypothetical protein